MPAIEFYNGFSNGEAEPKSSLRSAFIGPVQTIPYFWKVLLTDTNSRIFDRNNQLLCFLKSLDTNLSRCRGIFNSVIQQVSLYLPHSFRKA